MSFNLDVSKQAQEVIFSRKQAKSVHPDLFFNNTPDSLSKTFRSIFRHEISKTMKGISIIKKLNNVLPRKSLIQIYKYFVRSHLDYGDLIYN